MRRTLRRLRAVRLAVGLTAAAAAAASRAAPGGGEADWPMWRGNAGRTAATSRALPAELHLRWVRRLEAPAPAWPESQSKIRFDVSYEPVAAGKRLFVGSMASDRVTAYDTETGEELWRFYADGPIRLAPVAWKEKLYVVSDDGLLYCLDAASGRPRWTVRGGPDARRVLGNDRLVSAWPARGAPVLWAEPGGERATVYFAAGIWPFMGIFLHAVDAETGASVWENSGSGSIYVNQQHDSPAFAGVAPQGCLAATENTLLVSGGRTVPAAFDRRTGALLYFQVASRHFGKDAGGHDVSVAGGTFCNNGSLYSLADGSPLLSLGNRKLLPGLAAHALGDEVLVRTATNLTLYSLAPERTEETSREPYGKESRRKAYRLPCLGTAAIASPITNFHFRAGDRAYGAGEGGRIAAIDLPPSEPRVSWTGRVDGAVWSMLPADDKLFVVTRAGSIFCYGEQPAGAPREYAAAERAAPPSEGIAMLWGLGDGALERLLRLADHYQVVAVDPDPDKVAAIRRSLDDAGLYGRAVHVLAGRPAELQLPPYFAARIELGDPAAAGLNAGPAFARSVFHCLRPYGGVAALSGSRSQRSAFRRSAEAAALENARVVKGPHGLELRREGPLPGSAPWTHQYADAANTGVSREGLLKPPLGLLWFGGPANDDILPRHGHGPTPQVAGGRLFIEGPHALRAVDVYTGRLLWQRTLPDLGKFYDNTAHQPGANEVGANYVTAEDSLYAVLDRKCLRLDPATGETLAEFVLPPEDGKAPHWGFVSVCEDLLIAGAAPVAVFRGSTNEPPGLRPDVPYASSSRRLVVLDRHTGRVLWQRLAEQAFRHNTIVAGGGRIFCTDAISAANLELLRRRGQRPEGKPSLLALDARTGKLEWQVFPETAATWLGYSALHDLLVAGGSPGGDRAWDESVSGLAAYRGRDGERRWAQPGAHAGTPLLHGDTIYFEQRGLDLLTGRPLQRPHPLTGLPVEWSFRRHHGCNTPIACQHMLLFRSAAAGYYDLAANGGTANWGGFKSGCTMNLIPADGVLSAPDYTRTCTCSYQNQCSLALVPMADVETWTFQSYEAVTGEIRRVGINFGAPGDWPAPDGTLWLEYPKVGGAGPELKVQVEGRANYFRRHAMEVKGAAPQVTASGVEGAERIRIAAITAASQPYRVRLYFAEPGAEAGQRVFDVRLQGIPALSALDVAAETGGRRRGLVKEFRSVPLKEGLTIDLAPRAGSAYPPMLGGVELLPDADDPLPKPLQ